MPEGDIVLRVARRLDQALAGRPLLRGELRWPDLGGHDLAGRTIIGHGTYGKHMLTRLDDGRTLRTHLRMDGSWQVRRTGERDDGRGTRQRRRGGAGDPRRRPAGGSAPGAQVRAVLATEDWTALGLDLGMMDLVRTADEPHLLAHLGPDVLAPDLDARAAAARVLAQARRPVAEALLDQTVVAGLGTIYTAETLWAHRVWPWAPAGGLGDLAEELVLTARQLMLRSAAARTPTATGDPGRASHVHDRARRPCPRCGAPIRRGEAHAGTDPGLGTRPVFHCPACQPPP